MNGEMNMRVEERNEANGEGKTRSPSYHDLVSS